MKTCRNEKESLKKQYKKLQNQNLKKMLSGTNGPPYTTHVQFVTKYLFLVRSEEVCWQSTVRMIRPASVRFLFKSDHCVLKRYSCRKALLDVYLLSPALFGMTLQFRRRFVISVTYKWYFFFNFQLRVSYWSTVPYQNNENTFTFLLK